MLKLKMKIKKRTNKEIKREILTKSFKLNT